MSLLTSFYARAQGVNLPAHLVIIKSTEQWNSGIGFSEYNPIVIHQMIGYFQSSLFSATIMSEFPCSVVVCLFVCLFVYYFRTCRKTSVW
jgi:uncharacterized protein (DUF486 family)